MDLDSSESLVYRYSENHKYTIIRCQQRLLQEYTIIKSLQCELKMFELL